MGALTATAARAVAGAVAGAKSTPTKEKSSGVSSASKSGGSAKDAGSPKQVTPKVSSPTKGTGAVSKVSSTGSKGADASDIYGSASPSKPKTSVAKAGSSGKAVSGKVDGLTSKSVTTYKIDSNGNPIIPAAAPTTGFSAPTMEETRIEQRPLAPGMSTALGIAAGFPLMANDISEFLGAPDKQYNEITIPGQGTPTYDKVSDQPLSWGMMLDLLGTPETSSQYLSSGSPDRLPAEPVIRTAELPPFTPDNAYVGRTIDPSGDYSAPLGAIAAADVGSLPASERWGWSSPYAGMATTILQALGNDPKLPFVADVPPPKGLDAAVEPPSTWDNVVDNTGKLLSHTGLGGIVSTLFPDMWGGIGNAVKNIGSVQTKYPDEMAVALDDIYGERSQMKRDQEAKAKFPDLNHNGVDDRVEGYTGPDTKPKPGKTPPPGTTPPPTTGGNIPPPVFDASPQRTVQFPTMPPYDPGRSPEFMYFLNNHLADGGMVSAPAYAEGGEVDMSDPKVQLIGATEDVLEKIKGGAKPDEQDAKILKAFVAQFGDAALKSLNDNVGEGLSMKSGGGSRGRQIKGPGGPKDDAVPAVIVEEGSVVSPAKLSNNEFVMPVEAVMGIGEGDVELGAERMQQLAERLSAGKGGA